MTNTTNAAAVSVGLLRHSKTLWNEKKIIQGQQNSPLSEKGIKMAEEWGQHLHKWKWDILLTSDLGRATATADLVNTSLNIPIVVNRELREQNWGQWTGLTLEQIKELDKKTLKKEIAKGWLFQPPEGESREKVRQRARAALKDFCCENQGKKVLVICHEGVIKCILYHLLKRAFLPEEPPVLLPYHLHMITVQDQEIALHKPNFYSLPC